MAGDKITYIRVSEDADEDPIEIPCEEDNTVLLSTIASTFPGVSGMKYKNAKTGTMRALRLTDGRLNAPDEGWDANDVYICSFPKENKRKMEESGDNESNIKNKRVDSEDNETKSNDTDLIILGLAWKTTEKELTEYFNQYGELEMAEVKIDPRSGRSKGFGFVRFKDLTKHSELVGSRHQIDGRWCDVKLPVPREDEDGMPRQTRGRIFIGRLTRHIEEQDLKEYFSKFGDITDCYIPKPFRGFGFVTFDEAKHAKAASAGETTIKGVQLYVSYAMPKAEGAAFHGGYGGGAPRYGGPGGPGGWERSAPYGGGYDRGYERGPPAYGGYGGGYDRAPPRYGGGYSASGGYNSPGHYGPGSASGNGGPVGSGSSPNGNGPSNGNGAGNAYGSDSSNKFPPQGAAGYSDYGYGRPQATGGPGGRNDAPAYHTPAGDSPYSRATPYGSYREYSGYPGTGYRQ